MTNDVPSGKKTPLTPAARRYLWLDQGLIAIGCNFLINAVIAWSAFRDSEIVPVSGPRSLIEDTEATCFFLPFIACLIVSHLTRHEMQKGRFPPLPEFGWMKMLGEYASVSAFPRAMVFGVAGRMLVAPILVALIQSSGVTELPLVNFVVVKGLIATALGIGLCPLFAWIAMHDGKAISSKLR